MVDSQQRRQIVCDGGYFCANGASAVTLKQRSSNTFALGRFRRLEPKRLAIARVRRIAAALCENADFTSGRDDLDYLTEVRLAARSSRWRLPQRDAIGEPLALF
jgi:hypothetical protein